MNKKTLTIVVFATILFFMSKKANAKITPTNRVRGCDAQGCGGFLESRGNRPHYGVDFVTETGNTVFSPIAGKVTKFSNPYADDNRFTGIKIENEVYAIKIFYMSPSVAIGAMVAKGDVVGVAQDLLIKYSNITNHVHLEVVDKKTGKYINPLLLF